MKSSFIPVTCGVVLAAISAAGASHWFSVREMMLAYSAKPPLPSSPSAAPSAAPAAPETLVRTEPKPAAPVVSPAPAAPKPASSPAPAAPTNSSEEFFRSLVQEFKDLKNENRTLQDQLEETNRDLRNLQFRVDTHSTQFRPLPVMNDLKSMESSPADGQFEHGVLPPLDVELVPQNR